MVFGDWLRRRQPAPPAPSTSSAAQSGVAPLLPEATEEVWVAAGGAFKASQPAAESNVDLELLLLARPGPAEVSVRWRGKRIGTLNAAVSASLAPLIRKLAPESRTVRTTGAASWQDDHRVLVVFALVPDHATTERLISA